MFIGVNLLVFRLLCSSHTCILLFKCSWFSLKVPLPNRGPTPWYTVITATTLSGIQEICKEVLQLYKRDKPDADRLEQAVAKLKKVQLEAKARLKNSLGGGTPSTIISVSRPNTPTKVSPYTNEELRIKGDQQING